MTATLSQKEKGLILENTARMEQDLGKAMSQRGLDEQTGAKHWWWELELPVGNTHMRMQSDPVKPGHKWDTLLSSALVTQG